MQNEALRLTNAVSDRVYSTSALRLQPELGKRGPYARADRLLTEPREHGGPQRRGAPARFRALQVSISLCKSLRNALAFLTELLDVAAPGNVGKPCLWPPLTRAPCGTN